MKLLFDQNISFRLVKRIESLFPGSQQVKSLALENKTDKTIWDFAKKEEYTIVTFDSDYYDLSLTLSHPPKIIWIKTGNLTTNALEKLLTAKAEQIKSFISDSDLGCLEITD